MTWKKPIRAAVHFSSHIEIPLTRGQVALIDHEDVQLTAWNWMAEPGNSKRECFYAVRSNTEGDKPKLLRMHNLILPKRPGFVVDHINRNGLDNRRSNLRYATHGQNVANGVHHQRHYGSLKGAFKLPNDKRWTASITVNKKTYHLGRFDTEEQAHDAYMEAARRFHGEFARGS